MTIEEALIRADKGREIVESFVSNRMDNYVLVIFCEGDDKLLNNALNYLDRFMKDFDFTFILTSLDLQISEWTNQDYLEKKITDYDMDCVIRYASTVALPQIRIISTKKPWHRNADILLGLEDITMEKIVTRGLYEIKGAI